MTDPRRQQAEREIAAVNRALAAGYPPRGIKGNNHNPSAAAIAAKELGLNESSIRRRVGYPDSPGLWARLFGMAPNWGTSVDETPAPETVEFPVFPDEDVPVERLIDLQCERFEKRLAFEKAQEWFPIKVPEDKPFGLLLVGDPHLDDNGCNWPVLRRHVELCRDTPGLYAINIGDTTNCWGGRLIRKYADQDTSAATARRMAEWFLLKSGIRWLVWLYGNHEHMGGGEAILAEMARRHGTQRVVMKDWEARFTIQARVGEPISVNAAHNFPGKSIYNPLHGPVKAAKFGAAADLFVAGHLHNWGISHWEIPEKESAPLMVRVRGYKHLDGFARKLGFYDQDDGQSILVVCDPGAQTPSGRLTPFVDVERGISYLSWLRRQ